MLQLTRTEAQELLIIPFEEEAQELLNIPFGEEAQEFLNIPVEEEALTKFQESAPSWEVVQLTLK